MLELRQFRQFVAVAEERSFRRAAARLNMAQPPLTAAIRRIEDELGTDLIERTNRIERLTPAGEVFLVEARRALAQADRALEAAKRAGEGLTGSLRVTFVATAAHELLPRILRRFAERRPDVQLHLEEATTTQQVTALREDRADIGFVVPPLRDAEDLDLLTLQRGELVAVLPDPHPHASKPVIRLSDLAAEPWVLFPAHLGPGLHGRILSACTAAGFTPRVAQQAIQMETIVSLIAGGLGVSLVPSVLANGRRPGAIFRPLSGPGTPVGYDLAVAFRQRFPALEAFVECAEWAGAPSR